jgi:transcriptional regulator with GAF, ATPase, and Fis domain
MLREQFLGVDPAIRELMDLVHLVGPTSATVLITGETGTGKELIAGAIHECARGKQAVRRRELRGAAGALLESELFG